VDVSAATFLASVSGYFSVAGMSTLFAGAATAAVVMGGALEFAKLVGVSWLSRSWSTAFVALRWAILAMVVALMGLNAMGCYGYLTRAHLQGQLAGQIDVESRAAPVCQQIENKTAIVADLNRRIGQIDSAVEEATRRGRTKNAMDLVAQQTRARADLLAQRQVVASELADLRIRLATIDTQRQRVEAEVGPVRYVAELFGSHDLERAVRLLTLLVVVLLDPFAVLLLIAATSGRR